MNRADKLKSKIVILNERDAALKEEHLLRERLITIHKELSIAKDEIMSRLIYRRMMKKHMPKLNRLIHTARRDGEDGH